MQYVDKQLPCIMIKIFLQTQIYILVSLVFTVTSCNGQATPESLNDSPGLQGKTVAEYPKIPKPRGI